MNDQIVEYIVALRNKLTNAEKELSEYRDKNVELCNYIQELEDKNQTLNKMIEHIAKEYYELLEEVC